MFLLSIIAIADNGDDVVETDISEGVDGEAVVDSDVEENNEIIVDGEIIIIDFIEDNVTEEVIVDEDCGFWCKVYKFLFGDSELRASTGTAWFDREDALVGLGGEVCLTLPYDKWKSGNCLTAPQQENVKDLEKILPSSVKPKDVKKIWYDRNKLDKPGSNRFLVTNDVTKQLSFGAGGFELEEIPGWADHQYYVDYAIASKNTFFQMPMGDFQQQAETYGKLVASTKGQGVSNQQLYQMAKSGKPFPTAQFKKNGDYELGVMKNVNGKLVYEPTVTITRNSADFTEGEFEAFIKYNEPKTKAEYDKQLDSYKEWQKGLAFDQSNSFKAYVEEKQDAPAKAAADIAEATKKILQESKADFEKQEAAKAAAAAEKAKAEAAIAKAAAEEAKAQQVLDDYLAIEGDINEVEKKAKEAELEAKKKAAVAAKKKAVSIQAKADAEAAKKADEEAKLKAAAAKKAEEAAAIKAAEKAAEEAARKKAEAALAIENSKERIQNAASCFQTGINCKTVKGKKNELTHRQASIAMGELAASLENQVTSEKPTKEVLKSAPVGTTVKFNDKTYTKKSVVDGKAVDDKKKKDDEKTSAAETLQWVDSDGKVISAEEQALATATDYADLDAKELQAKAKELREAEETLGWQGNWVEGMFEDGGTYRAWTQGDWAGGQLFGGSLAVVGKLGSYQALSNALFPETSKAWLNWADSETLDRWADLPAFASSEWCGVDDAKRSDTPGQSSSFVRTQSGSYQFVGQVQAEKSKKETEILCEIDEDDEPYCSKGQVCVNDFCYADEDDNEKPDDDIPLKGKFYKIYWGVTAPQDESHTPYIDENRKAVKFNVRLEGDGEVWLYKTKGAIERGVMELENGESDSGLIVKFLNKDYNKVCIYFHSDYQVKDYYGGDVEEICTKFVFISEGKVEAGDSDSDSSSSSNAAVELNI